MTNKSELDEDDLRLLEASYRLVADAGAFHDVISRWAKRLERVDSKKLARLDQPMLIWHMRAVSEMLERSIEDHANDPVEQAISSVTAPAVVLTSGKRVAALNDRGAKLWSLKRGTESNLDWIESGSLGHIDQMLRTQGNANRQHAIVRTIDIDGNSGVAEIYHLLEKGSQGMIAIRGLELQWSLRIANMLQEAFGLTDAEVDVCRLLIDLRDTKLIAKERGSSFNTVRAQLLNIFDKTETTSQVDLVRLLALISQRLNHSFGGNSATWEDPLGREEIFTDQHGRAIAYSWAGDPDGRPALYSHGLATGYLLPNDGMAALKKHKIKLYAISRPGFGNSDPLPLGENVVQSNANAINALAGHLGIDRWTTMGQGSGSLPLFRAQSEQNSAINGIICVGIYFPFTNKMRFQDYSNLRRVALRLASASSTLAELIGKISYQAMRANGPEFIVNSIYSDCEVNRTVLQDVDCQAFIRTAYSMLCVHNHRALTSELGILTADWGSDLENCHVPVRFLHGTKDPADPVKQVQAFVDQRSNMHLDVVEDGGELLFFSHAEMLVDKLAEMMGG